MLILIETGAIAISDTTPRIPHHHGPSQRPYLMENPLYHVHITNQNRSNPAGQFFALRITPYAEASRGSPVEFHRRVALIDSNYRRRAAITHVLSASQVYAEPFETVDELLLHWPRVSSILVEDRDSNLQRLLEEVTVSGNWLPLVAFSIEPSTDRVVRAILDGAIDYAAWPCPADQLIAILDAAEASGATIGTLKLREARARSRLQKLTRREREVLTGVAGGLSNRLIGQRLEISPRTVEIHRANMLSKMGANHTSEAIRIAIEASLVA
jgi:two-component system, LuxR family, response regulator FixJ